MANNIQVGDVVEWDLVTHPDDHTQMRKDRFGPGPFVVKAIDPPGEKDPRLYITEDQRGVYVWRFKVNHFLTAVRKAKLSAEV